MLFAAIGWLQAFYATLAALGLLAASMLGVSCKFHSLAWSFCLAMWRHGVNTHMLPITLTREHRFKARFSELHFWLLVI
jgi:hypothetical protein